MWLIRGMAGACGQRGVCGLVQVVVVDTRWRATGSVEALARASVVCVGALGKDWVRGQGLTTTHEYV